MVSWKPGSAACEHGLLSIGNVSAPASPLLQSVCAIPFIATAIGTLAGPPVSTQGGYTLQESISARSTGVAVASLAQHGSAAYLNGTIGTNASFSIAFSAGVSPLQVNISVSLLSSGVNRVFLCFSSDAKEGIVGLGTQYSRWNLKGASMPILITEQGVGRGIEPLTWTLNTFGEGSGGNWHTSYGASPLFYTTRGRGFVLEGGDSTSVYGFNFTVADVLELSAWITDPRGALALTLCAIAAPTPSDFIREATVHTGRMQPLPAWTQTGAIVGFEGGTAAVRNITARLVAHNVPIAALWLQVWLGVVHHGVKLSVLIILISSSHLNSVVVACRTGAEWTSRPQARGCGGIGRCVNSFRPPVAIAVTLPVPCVMCPVCGTSAAVYMFGVRPHRLTLCTTRTGPS